MRGEILAHLESMGDSMAICLSGHADYLTLRERAAIWEVIRALYECREVVETAGKLAGKGD